VDSPEDVLLNVRDAVPVADLANLRGGLLVGEHGKVRPEVVLNLVVEPAVKEVVYVVAVSKVDRGEYLPEVE